MWDNMFLYPSLRVSRPILGMMFVVPSTTDDTTAGMCKWIHNGPLVFIRYVGDDVVDDIDAYFQTHSRDPIDNMGQIQTTQLSVQSQDGSQKSVLQEPLFEKHTTQIQDSLAPNTLFE